MRYVRNSFILFFFVGFSDRINAVVKRKKNHKSLSCGLVQVELNIWYPYERNNQINCVHIHLFFLYAIVWFSFIFFNEFSIPFDGICFLFCLAYFLTWCLFECLCVFVFFCDMQQMATYFPSFLWPFLEWYFMPLTFLYRFLHPGTGHANGFSFDALLPAVPECLQLFE